MAKLDYGHEHGVSDGGTAPVKGLDTLSHSIETFDWYCVYMCVFIDVEYIIAEQ